MTYKITLIEDDEGLVGSLQDLIENEGYKFQSYKSAEDFLWASSPEKTDLLIVDRNLPGQDGFSLVKKVREEHDKNYELPIIFLTVSLSDEDVIAGLDAGANDYVTKPFSGEVLMARIRASLRLIGKKDVKESTKKDWQLDEKTREVVISGERFPLSKREFQIFKELSENRGEVVTREDLLKIDEKISGRNVDVHVVSLRKKLDPTGVLIQTIRGVGYRVK